jgi:hypothetical protein
VEDTRGKFNLDRWHITLSHAGKVIMEGIPLLQQTGAGSSHGAGCRDLWSAIDGERGV